MVTTHKNSAKEQEKDVTELVVEGFPFVITAKMIAEIEASPSFRRRHQEAEEAVAKLDLSEVFGKTAQK